MCLYFRCFHCNKLIKRNKRLKGNQKYCNSKVCQQARKNQWEREKLQRDEGYFRTRKQAKAKWRKEKPAYQYQKTYRETHIKYKDKNKILQRKRCINAGFEIKVPTEKVVKTDALNATSLTGRGLYKILLHKQGRGEKIVKTDTLIVEIVTGQGIQEIVQTVQKRL